MKEVDLSPVHEAVEDAYKQAQNLQDDEFREEMVAGVVNVARQARAAEEMYENGLFEAAEALEYGAEGMADVYAMSQAKKEQAKAYQETMMEMFSRDSPNPVQAAEAAALAGATEKVEELEEQLEYAESAQVDTVAGLDVAEDTAHAYGGSLATLLNNYESLQRRVASKIQEGDEDMRTAIASLQEINPGDEEIDLGIKSTPEF